jgi:hypothetical protein
MSREMKIVSVETLVGIIIVRVKVIKDGNFSSIRAFKSISAFQPISTFKPIPAFEKIPVGSLNTSNKVECVPFWELQQRNSPEDQQNFWMILASLFSLIRHRLFNNNLQQDCYRKDETKQELSELKMLLQKSESLVLELRDSVTFMQEVEDKLYSQIQNQMASVKMMMKVVDKSHVQLQNEVGQWRRMMTLPLPE